MRYAVRVALLAVAVAACDSDKDNDTNNDGGGDAGTASTAAEGSDSQGDATAGTEGSGADGDSGSGGAGADCDLSALPMPRDPCLEGCGNELHVGRPCSEGGGECTSDDFNNATFCTVDFVPDAELNQCTKPCVADDQCGSGAFCQADPDDPNGPRGCVPIACDPEGYEMSMMD